MKNLIRQSNKQKRSLLTKKEVEEKSICASDLLIKSEFYKNSQEIMLYMPLGNETDTTFIIQQAIKDGKKLIFPVTDEESGEITPYYADQNTRFKKGAFSVNEPEKERKANPLDIDVVIVPGIAFSKDGARVGFGKGCYDKFLIKTNAVKVGFCYDFQLLDKFQVDEHDVMMDYIITEKGVISI